jgi:hypothetical protein
MGFDRRTWVHAPPRGRQVTRNLDALLAENEALRQEVAHLRQHLARMQACGTDGAAPAGRGAGITTGSAPGITAEQVRLWGEDLARHPRWRELRFGAPRRREEGSVQGDLRSLIEDLQALGPLGPGDLEEVLERRSPGLGRELGWALKGPQSKARQAVKAAFALYGVGAPERLSQEPLAVVDDLLAAIERLEAAARQARQERARAERERTQKRAREPVGACRKAEALQILGLRAGASNEAVKLAHRRLVKQHHPDLGGDAEAFRRIDAAYRLLIA